MSNATQCGHLVKEGADVLNLFHSSCVDLNMAVPVATREKERGEERGRGVIKISIIGTRHTMNLNIKVNSHEG